MKLMPIEPHCLHRLWAAAIAITVLCVQQAIVIMDTSKPTQEKEKASWTDQEMSELVEYLYNNWSQAGDNGNFKMSTFNAAVEHLAPFKKGGATKTGKICKTK